jgi:peptidoglycan L-alanyl-D-glutamate endopeptidase CwlK
MPKFSTASKNRLYSCEKDLIRLFEVVAEKHDCTILEGHRSAAKQARLLKQGKSKVKVSKHNNTPSLAVDVSPYPIPEKWGESNFKEKAKFYYFAGIVKGAADNLRINIRWGGDWDNDSHFNDQTFDDLVHFELL